MALRELLAEQRERLESLSRQQGLSWMATPEPPRRPGHSAPRSRAWIACAQLRSSRCSKCRGKS
jgi:hypothetical protein